jgi:DNA modification methylase
MSLKPYYGPHAGITICHGDCREILPTLPKCDLLLTDPPYGIEQDRGMGNGGVRLASVARYEGGWDRIRPSAELLSMCVSSATDSVIWGGNYFADKLPPSSRWLVWDKEQTMPSYSDAELAWTSMKGTSTKMFRQCAAGMMATEKDRWHPTQKPLALMKWCLSLFPDAKTVIDPFAGSGTTGVACKAMGLTCTMIEREEKYCEIAAKRLSQEVLNFEATA